MQPACSQPSSPPLTSFFYLYIPIQFALYPSAVDQIRLYLYPNANHPMDTLARVVNIEHQDVLGSDSGQLVHDQSNLLALNHGTHSNPAFLIEGGDGC